MALFALTFRVLLTLSVAVSPMVCYCSTTGTATEVQYDGGPTQPLAMLDSANPHSSCPSQTVPSSMPSPSSHPKHAPGSCLDCLESVSATDNTLGAALMSSRTIFPDALSFTGPLWWIGGMIPDPPRLGMVAKPQAEFGGDSLHGLSRLLMI